MSRSPRLQVEALTTLTQAQAVTPMAEVQAQEVTPEVRTTTSR